MVAPPPPKIKTPQLAYDWNSRRLRGQGQAYQNSRIKCKETASEASSLQVDSHPMLVSLDHMSYSLTS